MPYKRNYGVYQIQSEMYPDRIYIGSSQNIRSRWKDHRHDLKLNIHDNWKLQTHYNEYGLSDMVMSIVEEHTFATQSFLFEREQYYLDTLSPWFNISKNAEKAGLGHIVPPELIEKVRKAAIGRKDTEETKRKRSESHKGKYGVNNGRKFPNRNNDAFKGERNGFYGKKHTPETIKKISEAKRKQQQQP